MVKLIIQPFKDNQFTEEVKGKTFTAPINPDTINKSFKISVDANSGHGNEGTNLQYVLTQPQEMKFDFILDGTGVVEGYPSEYKDMPVSKQIKKFMECAYDTNPETHHPWYLQIIWGSEVRFKCMLTSFDINHTLLDPDGNPIRAKISATFMEYRSVQERIRSERHSSPDLTHQFKVEQGDRLDLMTYKVYNDTSYLLQVAKTNGLTSLRNLKAGISLSFYPLDKTTA